MNSIQSSTVQMIVKLMRRSLFIHKTETHTHRVSFERLASITKYPRFVEKEEVKFAGISAAWFKAAKSSNDKVILYLHGGGYCVGSYNSHRAMIARLARAAGHPVLAINYAKAPENPYPAALEDAVQVYQQMLADGWKNIFISGDSAGGGLSLALSLKIKELKLPMPTALMLISPWTDLTGSGDSVVRKADEDPLIAPELLEVFAKKYYVDHDPKLPFISPLFADLSGLPPTLIQVGTREVLLDDSTRLAKKMKEAGVQVELEIWDHMMHVWHWMAGIMPEGNEAIAKMGAYVQRTFSSASKEEAQGSLHMELY
jgi:epsilon-lactone hydrolase